MHRIPILSALDASVWMLLSRVCNWSAVSIWPIAWPGMKFRGMIGAAPSGVPPVGVLSLGFTMKFVVKVAVARAQ